jgi:hypothetical protein
MSAFTAGAFAPELREVERGLALPIPARVRILQELESDLEELMDRLVDEGSPPEEARRLALEALVPNTETLEALGSLHSPLYRRLTRHLSTGRVRKAERSALGLSTAAVLLVQTGTLLRANLLQDPSPFLVPVLLAGAFLSALVFWKAFRFWIKKDHVSPGRGLGAILGISGTILAPKKPEHDLHLPMGTPPLSIQITTFGRLLLHALGSHLFPFSLDPLVSAIYCPGKSGAL